MSRYRFVLVFACLLLSSCTDPSQSYSYHDARLAHGSRFYWRDDDHVLFFGPDRIIYLLNGRSGARHAHGRIDGESPFFCFSHGTILYSKGGQIYTGKFGSEKPDPQTAKKISEGRLDWLRCTPPDLPPIAKHPEFLVPLLEEHGFLEMRFAAGSQRTSCEHECDIYLWMRGAAEPVKIQKYTLWNGRNLQGGSYPLHFIPFKGAYFIWGDSIRKPGVRGHWIGWWLFPDGKTEDITIPDGRWHRFSRVNHEYMPWRDGLLIAVGHPDNQIHLLRRDGQGYSAPRVIYSGSPWGKVSPDGCRLAVRKTRNTSTTESYDHIEVHDLCSDKQNR